MKTIPSYQDSIKALFAGQQPEIPAHHILGWMRVERSTLDGMSKAQFNRLARSCRLTAIEAGAEMSEKLAASYGLRA